MKSGPKPTPTALRELRGNPGRRPLPVNEPEPSGLEEVDPPAHLSTEAKREWRRLAPELIRLRLLTVADFAAFTGYCSAWSDFIEADRVLRRDGIVTKGKEGQPVRSPWFLVKARAIDQLIKFGDRFGFTPSARASLASDGRAVPSPARPGVQISSLAAYLREKPDRLPDDVDLDDA